MKSSVLETDVTAVVPSGLSREVRGRVVSHGEEMKGEERTFS